MIKSNFNFSFTDVKSSKADLIRLAKQENPLIITA